MQIALAGLMHESNTFSSTPTTHELFLQGTITRGPAILKEWGQAHHEMGGFIHGAELSGFTPRPITMSWATPAGPVESSVLDQFCEEICNELSPNDEGILLAIHGAMVVDGFPDGDGELLRRIRAHVGPEFPILATLDFHANVSQQMVDQSDALVCYQTNPHIDQRQRGVLAADIMHKFVRGEIRPVQKLSKPPSLITICCQNTSRAPLLEFMVAAHEFEKQQPFLSVNVLAGFPYADVEEMGPSVIVVTDNNPDLASSTATELSQMLYHARQKLVRSLEAPNAAVKQAKELAGPRPVILVDFGDNIGGGSPGDSTVLLHELISQKVPSSLIAIYDPETVKACQRAGIGSAVSVAVGGKSDQLHGTPVSLTGMVRLLHNGQWVEHEARHGGRRNNDQGDTVVLDVEVVAGKPPLTIIVNSKRTPPFSLGQITSLGIDPASTDVIVVKAAVAYRAAYEPLNGTIIEVDTPGLTANDPRHFTYQRVRSPLYPLD